MVKTPINSPESQLIFFSLSPHLEATTCEPHLPLSLSLSFFPSPTMLLSLSLSFAHSQSKPFGQALVADELHVPHRRVAQPPKPHYQQSSPTMRRDDNCSQCMVVASPWPLGVFSGDSTVRSLGFHRKMTGLELLYKPMPRSSANVHVFR